MPAPCGISVSPRREHDFDSFAFSSGYLKSVEKMLKIYTKSMKNRSKIVIENELFYNIDFSSNVHVFSKPPPRGHFSRDPAPIEAQKCDIKPILDPRWAPKRPLEAQFSAKKAPKGLPGKFREASWNRPVRDLTPKTSRGRILIDFGSIFG